MPRNPFEINIKPIKIKSNFGISPRNKKRKTLTPAQRIYIWERPNIYGRMCSICNKRITKLSNLELDHTRAHSKGGTKLALAHKDCNRAKSSGSLSKIQKLLGIKTKKRRNIKRKTKRNIPEGNYWINPLTGRKEKSNPFEF